MEVKQPTSTRELYKTLFIRLRNLIVSPAREWVEIFSEKSTLNDMLSGFSLPLIGLAALTTFLNFLINQQALIFELALKHALLVLSSLLGGLFLAYYLAYKFLKVIQPRDLKAEVAKLIVYSSAPLYVVSIIESLVPEIFFIQIFSFYSFYLTWMGIHALPVVAKDKKSVLSVALGALVLVIPYLIRLLLLNLLSI